MWTALVDALLPRLRDKIAAVRVKAVAAAERLQDAHDDGAALDPVAAELACRARADASPDVRAAAACALLRGPHTAAVLARARRGGGGARAGGRARRRRSIDAMRAMRRCTYGTVLLRC